MGASGSSYTQANRLLSIDTPLGTDALLLQGLTGGEGISRMFSYDLDLLAYGNDSITFNDIVGQNVTITIQLADGTPRYINGYVSRFAQGATDDRYFTHYTAQVVPWLWFLTRQADCRIFQNLAVPDIITQVFGLFSGFPKFQNKLTGTYPTLEYCVQYRETSFNFVSRLMEENGIFYYFDHTTQGQHTMVLADAPTAFVNCPDVSTASYNTGGGVDNQDVVSSWHIEQELRTGKYTLTDYNFTTPSTSLLADSPTVVDLDASKSLELFDYPGPHETIDQGTAVAKLRIEEEEASYMVANGSSTCRWFVSGYQYTLENHDRSDQNTTYILTEVQHVASAGATYTSGTTDTEHYSNHFTCIPSAVTYRPVRVTPKPFVQGPQPALVVGKSGEEIWTDSYGRVKVQFYWDRVGTDDENSSCWIRVSSPWAGQNWGAISLPRIGQEVIVDFLEGDPDRPIIMGRVYNASQMPPYTLPDNQTRSTVQSRSSKGGGTANYNEIRFEDLKGSEQIFINAEMDMDHRVEHDSREYIGNNRHLAVNASQFEQVNTDKHLQVGGKQYEQITSDESHQVGGNYMESVTGKHSVNISGDRKESVGGNDSRSVTGNVNDSVTGNASLSVTGNQNESITQNFSRQVTGSINEMAAQSVSQQIGQNYNQQAGQNVNVTAGMNINLSGGMAVNIMGGSTGVSIVGPGGFISITAAGIAIMGTLVLINSGGAPTPADPAVCQSPSSPSSPDSPDAPTAPTKPDTADDGSKGTKLS
ncbi:MAG: type VI secretion system tip protein TssI/VgrG [Terriglobia bacterium]|jgi:type VI secretion system secreted protein VgrG